MDSVKISEIQLIENNYVRRGTTWNVLKLIEASKDIKPFDLPLQGIDISISPWGNHLNIKQFVYHSKRIKKTKLKYPVILDDEGFICDGWHRVCKALLKNKKTIKAIRLVNMPEPDKIQ